MLVRAEVFNDFCAFFDNDFGFDDICSFRSRFGRRMHPELEAPVRCFAILQRRALFARSVDWSPRGNGLCRR